MNNNGTSRTRDTGISTESRSISVQNSEATRIRALLPFDSFYFNVNLYITVCAMINQIIRFSFPMWATCNLSDLRDGVTQRNWKSRSIFTLITAEISFSDALLSSCSFVSYRVMLSFVFFTNFHSFHPNHFRSILLPFLRHLTLPLELVFQRHCYTQCVLEIQVFTKTIELDYIFKQNSSLCQ